MERRSFRVRRAGGGFHVPGGRLRAYALLARRATRSLAALTDAADRVGAGDCTPALPPVGRDEVGRLTTAFRLMIAQVRESLQQLEASRQMAAVGAFASQIFHEIRNPLTSLQLNLQGLERDVRHGRIPPDLARPVELCLKEVHRLDGVASGVLSLARPRRPDTAPYSLHGVIDDALEVFRAQLGAAGVTVHTRFLAERDTVVGSAEDLNSVIFNLCRNAVEAMPGGGNLHVSTEPTWAPGNRAGIPVCVEDDGVGIPADVRDEIFKPFFTTKKDGTGIGLSLAARIVEEHRGTIGRPPGKLLAFSARCGGRRPSRSLGPPGGPNASPRTQAFAPPHDLPTAPESILRRTAAWQWHRARLALSSPEGAPLYVRGEPRQGLLTASITNTRRSS